MASIKRKIAKPINELPNSSKRELRTNFSKLVEVCKDPKRIFGYAMIFKILTEAVQNLRNSL